MINQNPFEELDIQEFLEIFPIERFFIKLLCEEHKVIQFIGGTGYGKTHLLRQINNYYYKKGGNPFYYYIPRLGFNINEIDLQTELLLLDETNNLNEEILLNILQNRIEANLRTIISSHPDVVKFELPNKVVNLEIINPKRVVLLIRKALINSNYSHITITSNAITKLNELTHGNLKAVRSVMYEIFEFKELPNIISEKNIINAYDIFKNSILSLA